MTENHAAGITSAQERESLITRFEQVRRRIRQASQRAGSPNEVKLIAVSKFHPAEAVMTLAEYWLAQGDRPRFGENYMQEAEAKQDTVRAALGPRANMVEWHFIGHLQSKKAKQAAGRFALIHSLDSPSLAQNLQKRLEESNSGQSAATTQAVLVQINLGNEAQKSGLNAAGAESFIRLLHDYTHLRVCGLMGMPPLFEDGEASRPYYRALRQLRDDLRQRLALELPELSMGMSHDLEAAIEEGATMVRVGTDIFGPRPTKETLTGTR